MDAKEAKELTKNRGDVFIIPKGQEPPIIPTLHGARAITLVIEETISQSPSGHNRFISLEQFSDETDEETRRLELMDKLKREFKEI